MEKHDTKLQEEPYPFAWLLAEKDWDEVLDFLCALPLGAVILLASILL
jgi:hypothetical protein